LTERVLSPLTRSFWVPLVSFLPCTRSKQNARETLSQRIGSLSEDAFGYARERQDPGAIFTLGCDLARQSKRNGIFRSDWPRGLAVPAVDGFEICSSFARSCEHSMERKEPSNCSEMTSP
jgi:hypothetical protein